MKSADHQAHAAGRRPVTRARGTSGAGRSDAGRGDAGRGEAGRGDVGGGDAGGARASLARAAIAAIEPLIDLFLELGITSPEAESLLRSLFVHRSRAWLALQDPAVIPSDVRVALVTGVHRNFVARLLTAPPGIAETRVRKGRRAARLLRAWHIESAYLDSSGKPRDLPERGPAPSFEALSKKYVPGVTPGIVLRELRRAGAIALLDDQRVRVRASAVRVPGVSSANLGEMSRQASALLRVWLHNLRDPDHRLLCESLPAITVEAARVPLVRDVINRRTMVFLQSLEAELAPEQSRARSRRARRARVSMTVFETNGTI